MFDLSWLFVSVEPGVYTRGLVGEQARFLRPGHRLTHWVLAHTAPGGSVITPPHDARRLRKTAKTLRVAALGGTVSDLAGDDHHVEVFRGHYAHGTTAHILAARAVTTAQRRVFERVAAKPVFVDEAARTRLEEPAVAAALGLSAPVAAAMGAGVLDMGLTNCRDPYDSPHTPTGSVCHVAPTMCVLCRNAVVFTSQLPRLVLLAEHIERMRAALDPPRWQAVWGAQAAALAALFEQVADAMPAARAASADAVLDLPLGLRTEYDR